MKLFKSKITEIILVVILAIIILLTSIAISNVRGTKPKSVKSNLKLEAIYNADVNKDFAIRMIGYVLNFPYSAFSNVNYIGRNDYTSSGTWTFDGVEYWQPSGSISSVGSSGNSSSSSESSSDYSKTNVQVENVDEADVIKTDGEYTYSISEDTVIIADVRDVENTKIASRLKPTSGIPVDLLLYDKYLIVIGRDSSRKNSTDVEIYDVEDKNKIEKVKSYEIGKSYKTSRILNGKLYIVSSGKLSKNSDQKIEISYNEDGSNKDINLKKMYYFKDKSSDYETVISNVNLDDISNSTFDVQAYLIDVDYIYMSENNLYIANWNYKESENSVLKLFGFKGIFSMMDDENYDKETTIVKLGINEDGSVSYVGKAKLDGSAINQFSFDEYNSNLRVALEDNEKSRIVVLNEKMKQIGVSEAVGEGESMYSSRFVGDRAYLVTFKYTDPLFTFDLSNPKKPKLLGELKMPGYSTYIHPYDENHLIGIGVQTEEVVVRDTQGEIRGSNTYVTGLKMAIFDVTDVNNPKQLSDVTIGDKNTKSPILTNHKALLFSKEKGIIAIPVNSYSSQITEQTVSTTDVEKLVDKYNTGSSSDYISEGYLIYNIDTENGISLKGVIEHSSANKNTKSYGSQVLRGLYIKDSLITISQHMLKVNNLQTLKEISTMGI